MPTAGALSASIACQTHTSALRTVLFKTWLSTPQTWEKLNRPEGCWSLSPQQPGKNLHYSCSIAQNEGVNILALLFPCPCPGCIWSSPRLSLDSLCNVRQSTFSPISALLCLQVLCCSECELRIKIYPYLSGGAVLSSALLELALVHAMQEPQRLRAQHLIKHSKSLHVTGNEELF